MRAQTDKKGLARMRAARGSNPDFKIVTHSHNLAVVGCESDCSGKGTLVSGTYKEMQRGAKNCGVHNGANGRISVRADIYH